MPILNGPWQGTPYQARIICTYNVSYTGDHTQAIYAISFSVEFEGAVSDSTNSWSVSGDCGSASGSNVAYSIPSGGGTKVFRSGESAQKYGDASVSASISAVQAVGGGTISGSFTLDSGALAPYFTDSSYAMTSITNTGAVIYGWSAAGNGGSLNNVQTQYNTSGATATGATTVTRGSYAGSQALSGLAPNTLYYARVRVANSTYGYGEWGPWISFRTLSGLPSPPSEAWSFDTVRQDSVNISGISVPDNGGSAIDQILVRFSTDPAFGSYSDFTAGNVASLLVSGLLPGTVYYVKIYAHNANGYSSPTSAKAFQTLFGASVNVGGVWKDAVPYVNVGGVWKIAIRYDAISNNAGGVNWKS